jgi:hypothetical protein
VRCVQYHYDYLDKPIRRLLQYRTLGPCQGRGDPVEFNVLRHTTRLGLQPTIQESCINQAHVRDGCPPFDPESFALFRAIISVLQIFYTLKEVFSQKERSATAEAIPCLATAFNPSDLPTAHCPCGECVCRRRTKVSNLAEKGS